MQYQKRDWEIVDYQGYILKNTNEIDVRGPEPKSLENNQYFVFIDEYFLHIFVIGLEISLNVSII